MRDASNHLALARARQALKSARLPYDGPLERADSTRNEVFLNDKYVIRINRHPNQRLRREALLYRSLPPAMWTPEPVAHGGELGADYLIVRRKPGQPLSRAWPDLSTQSRREAVRQLCAALNTLHETLTPVDLPRLEVQTHLIDPRCVSPLVPLLLAINELQANPALDRGVLEAAEAMALDLGDALVDYSQRTLIHGDLTFENVLWDGTHMSGLLDFEWCRGGADDLDLDVLLRFCAFPFAHVAADYEDQAQPIAYVDVPGWLAEDMPELFAHPRLADRLMLYCLAFDVRDLTENVPAKGRRLGPLHPMNRLRRLVSSGGHVAPLLERIGLPV